MASPPTALSTLVTRFDPQVFNVGRARARVRLEVTGEGGWDVELADGAARLREANGGRPAAPPAPRRGSLGPPAPDLRGGRGAFPPRAPQGRPHPHPPPGLLPPP